MSISRFALVVAISSMGIGSAFAQNETKEPSPGIIAISGHGEVFATPDQAIVTSGVTTQGATAREALDANTEAMAALVELVKSRGVEARDIQTSGFSVQPQYQYSNETDAQGYARPPRINGYQVSNNVSIRIDDLESLGSVLDEMVDVGANTINGISFSVEETDGLLDDARSKAFADAERKARIYAEAAGLELGRILSISEGNGGFQPPVPMMKMQAMAMDARVASPVPVQAGEMSYGIDVSVQWALAGQ